jgi:hypothetical protein
MYTVWHVDKYKITFKLVINWTNEILQHIVISSVLSRPGIIDARARYRAAARWLRNTALNCPAAISMRLQFVTSCALYQPPPYGTPSPFDITLQATSNPNYML